jgi:hypothetical protein
MHTNHLMQNASVLSLRGASILLLVVASLAVREVRAAAPVPAALPQPAVIPQSNFESVPPAGKDPFFPNSTRIGAKIVKTEVVVAPLPEISLKGITGTTAKRLCILNNRTFEVGEETELRSAGQLIKVKCLEIKNKSVVVTINGIEKELNLGTK